MFADKSIGFGAQTQPTGLLSRPPVWRIPSKDALGLRRSDNVPQVNMREGNSHISDDRHMPPTAESADLASNQQSNRQSVVPFSRFLKLGPNLCRKVSELWAVDGEKL